MRKADRHCYLSFQSALRRTEILLRNNESVAGREIARYSLIVDYLAKWDAMGGNERNSSDRDPRSSLATPTWRGDSLCALME